MSVIKPVSITNLYEQDFYLWIETTAKLLKKKEFDLVDWDNLIEEIESMGRSERKELKSRLIVLIEHLLKLLYWDAEKTYNLRGWRSTVVEQRRQLVLSLEDSPSLQVILADVFVDCYQKARKDFLQISQLSSNLVSTEPLFTLEDVLNPDYLPK